MTETTCSHHELHIHWFVSVFSILFTYAVHRHSLDHEHFSNNPTTGFKYYRTMGCLKIAIGISLLTILYPWDCPKQYQYYYGFIAVGVGVLWLRKALVFESRIRPPVSIPSAFQRLFSTNPSPTPTTTNPVQTPENPGPFSSMFQSLIGTPATNPGPAPDNRGTYVPPGMPV
jgi:hypothetical protein